MIARRSLLRGLFGVLAAPAIIKVAQLMPISVQPPRLITAIDVYQTDFGTINLTEARRAFYEWSPDVVREDLANIILNITPIDTPFAWLVNEQARLGIVA